MELRLRVTRKRILFFVMALALVAAGGVSYAAIADTGTVYSACKLSSTGTIRLIDPKAPSTSLLSHCSSFETAFSFNQKGQPGDPGSPGAPGTPGQSVTSSAVGVGDSNCPAGGAKFTSSSGATYACNGAKGDKGDPGAGGAKGDKGDKGDPGASLIGSACSTGGGATGGTVQMTVASSGAISLTCVGGGGSGGGGECTPVVHSNGLGQTYSLPCPSALGVPGTAATYTLAMALAAANAWAPSAPNGATQSVCGNASVVVITNAQNQSSVWAYSGTLAGHVFTSPEAYCPLVTDPTWN